MIKAVTETCGLGPNDLMRTGDLCSCGQLSREQKGRFVALCWIAQIYRHIPDPKPSYVADWDDLPAWQRETGADIFERIEGVN